MAGKAKQGGSVFNSPSDRSVEAAYKAARERFGAFGIDTDKAVKAALDIPVSIHCWQADDVRGLEVKEEGGSGGGIQSTGNYPGLPRNVAELRQDLDKAASLIPGKVRFSMHAIYAETGGKSVGREKLEPRHFQGWIDWAKQRKYGLDFNASCFGHKMLKDGMTLSSPDAGVRKFWVEHCQASRAIAASMAKQLKSPCVNNIWVPDGSKEEPVDRWSPRARLEKSLDQVLAKKYPGVKDAVESKLFGIGCESYTVGSNEFYTGYAARRGNVGLCLDLGHFHPTESVADKVSAVAPWAPFILLHASRGVRWDSDHVVLLNKELQDICDEAVRGGVLDKMAFATDYFDGSLNRICAYVVGVRAVRKGVLRAMLEPTNVLCGLESSGKQGHKLAIMEHRLELPFGAVWDYACLKSNKPVGVSWLGEVDSYEGRVLSHR